MNLLLRIRHGLPNTLAATGLMALAGLCSGVVLARALGPTQRGELAAVLLWPMALGVLGELGLNFAFSYRVAKNPDSISGIWTLCWGTSLVWGGALALGGAALVPSLLDAQAVVSRSLQWAMLTVPLTLATGYQAYMLLGANLLTDFNVVRVYGAASYTAAVVGIAAVGWAGVENFTLAYVVSQASACLLATALTIWRLRPSWRLRPGLIRPLLAYGLRAYASSIAAQMNLRLDQLLMTSMVSPGVLGLYVVAVAVSGLVSPLHTALAVVVLPRVTHTESLLEGGRQAVRHLQLGTVVGLPLVLVAAAAAPWGIPLIFGDAFDRAVIPAQILLLTAVFKGTNLVLGNSLRGLGQPGKAAIGEGIGLVLTLGLLLMLLPRFGALGAAIASLCANTSATFTQTAYVRRAAGLAWRDFVVVRWHLLFPRAAVLERPGRDASG